MPNALLRACSGRPLCPNLVTAGRCKDCSRATEQRRGNYDVRRWYRTAAWRHVRERVLREEPFCPECEAETGRVVENTDVHHKRKHYGDRRLFFARENLEGLCHAHHSRHTARGE